MRIYDELRAAFIHVVYTVEALHSATLLASSSLGLSSAICLTEPNVELNFLGPEG